MESNGAKNANVLEILDEMAEAGLVVSICYGRCGSLGIAWSVDVLHDAESFAKPYSAASFEHAVWIAREESRNRGWL